MTDAGQALRDQWAGFVDRLRAADERLLSEVQVSWEDLRTIAGPLLAPWEPGEASRLIRPELEDFQNARREAARLLLEEPLADWGRKRPFRRVWMALESYDRSIEDLTRALPESLPISGAEVFAPLQRHGPFNFWKRVSRFRRKPRPLPLQRIVASEFQRRLRARSEMECATFALLGRAVRRLRSAWEQRRAVIDAGVRGRPPAEQPVRQQTEEARKALEQLLRDGLSTLEGWRSANESAPRGVAGRLLSIAAWPRDAGAFSAGEERAAVLAHRSMEWRTLEREMQLEVELVRCEDEILGLFRQMLANLHQELDALLSELDGVLDWLRRRIEQDSKDEFPPPKADVVPASSRLFEIETSVKSVLHSLPESHPSLAELSGGSRKPRTRVMNPRATYLEAFQRSGRGEMAFLLEEIEAEHRKLVQEIERARQVVSYGTETAGGEDRTAVMQEALRNALSLLEYYRGERPDWRQRADLRTARILAAVFSEGRLILTRHRLGALAYLAEQGVRRGSLMASRSVSTALGHLLVRAFHNLEIAAARFLVYIGWKSAPSAGRVDVVVRPLLPSEFTADLERKELPALYRRLFRFEPVSDPRFLVGRESEMTAIADARSLWEAGRPVAVIIVGERGSGKTSLINCAIKRCLADLEVVRAEFRERLTDDEQLRAWLARFVGAADPAGLEQQLTERRRVIVLEELERTFLRQVGRYGAIRGLQRIITATCSSTLWILGTNQVAFRFLDAALHLASSFSHRIYAATASREDVRRAILLRHNLSGLRLQFAERSEPRTALQRLERSLRKESGADAEFFDALSGESGGIYRSALEIWLGQIQAAHAGVLYMNLLELPDLSPVIDELDMPDLFTLVAILQHGSLTPEEHSIVFDSSLPDSRSRLDELLTREIIEIDPGREGYRVRPEAMRLVNEALYRRNLL